MQWVDYALLIVLGALVCFALYYLHENRRKGKGCCGNCTACAHTCNHQKYHMPKK